MNLPLLAAAAATLLLLSACGSGGSDATAAGAGPLTDSECALLADRHRDFTLAQVPPESAAQIRDTAEQAKSLIAEACRNGEMFTRADHTCAAATAPNSAESHACIAEVD
jgi:hypothetical protein